MHFGGIFNSSFRSTSLFSWLSCRRFLIGVKGPHFCTPSRLAFHPWKSGLGVLTSCFSVIKVRFLRNEITQSGHLKFDQYHLLEIPKNPVHFQSFWCIVCNLLRSFSASEPAHLLRTASIVLCRMIFVSSSSFWTLVIGSASSGFWYFWSITSISPKPFTLASTGHWDRGT